MRNPTAHMGHLQSLCSGTSQSSWWLSYAFTINPMDTCSLWLWWSLFLQASVCLYCKSKAPERTVAVQDVASCYPIFRDFHDNGSCYELCKWVLAFLVFPPFCFSEVCCVWWCWCPAHIRLAHRTSSEDSLSTYGMLLLQEGVLWTEVCVPWWVGWSECCRVYNPRRNP